MQNGVVGGEDGRHVDSGVLWFLGVGLAWVDGRGDGVGEDQTVFGGFSRVAPGGLGWVGAGRWVAVGQGWGVCGAGQVGKAVVGQGVGVGGVVSRCRGLRGQLAVHDVVHVLAVLAVLSRQSLLYGPGGGQGGAVTLTLPVRERGRKDERMGRDGGMGKEGEEVQEKEREINRGNEGERWERARNVDKVRGWFSDTGTGKAGEELEEKERMRESKVMRTRGGDIEGAGRETLWRTTEGGSKR